MSENFLEWVFGKQYRRQTVTLIQIFPILIDNNVIKFLEKSDELCQKR